jgi:hypothetical protein
VPGQERRRGQEEYGNKLTRMADRGGAKRMPRPCRENQGRFHEPRAPQHARIPKEPSLLVVTWQMNHGHVVPIWPSCIQLGSVEPKRERCGKHLGKDWEHSRGTSRMRGLPERIDLKHAWWEEEAWQRFS